MWEGVNYSGAAGFADWPAAGGGARRNHGGRRCRDRRHRDGYSMTTYITASRLYTLYMYILLLMLNGRFTT